MKRIYGLDAGYGTEVAASTLNTHLVLADLKSDVTAAAGQYLSTSGYSTPYDKGGATYKIVSVTDFGGVPDGYGDHVLANGLVAQIIHNGVLKAESFGCVDGVDMSAGLQAAWNNLVRRQDAVGNDEPFTLTLSSSGSLSNRVLFRHPTGGVRVKNSNFDFSSSFLQAVTGGNLSPTVAMFVCRFSGGAHYWGVLDGGKFAACYDFNGVGASRSYNPTALHHKGFGFRVTGGGNGSFALYNPFVTEYNQLDAEFNTQANFTSRGFSVEDGDFNVYNANILFNKTGIYLTEEPVQVHFVNAHIVGGNPNHGGGVLPFFNMVLVENHATRINHFDVCYFDNGVVDDYATTLNITGGHYVDNGAATLTHPLVRLYAKSMGDVTLDQVAIRSVAGLTSVGLVDNLPKYWAGSLTLQATHFTGMASENSVKNAFKKEYRLFSAHDDVIQVNLKAQGSFEKIWQSNTGDVRTEIDPEASKIAYTAGTLRLKNPGLNKAVYLGGGEVGIGERATDPGDLDLWAGNNIRWTLKSDGDLLPKLNNDGDLGGTLFRMRKTWTNIVGVGAGNVELLAGDGSPEGVISAAVGSLYFNQTGAAGTSLFWKQSGAGSAGWASLSGYMDLGSDQVVTGSKVFAGDVFFKMGSVTNFAASATFTVADIRSGLIRYTNGSAGNLTFPLGTAFDSFILVNNTAFKFSVVNTGAGLVTMTPNTGVSIIGSATVNGVSSAEYAVRRIGAGSYNAYRMT